jgi:adenylate cyclase
VAESSDKKPEFAPYDIESQMERILNSPQFKAADLQSRFLRYIVEETLAGRKDQIKQYTVGVHALGRDAAFNPQIDPMVRMQARRLRRALDRYYETNGVNDPIRIEIPLGRYIPVFLPNGRGSSLSPESTATKHESSPLSEPSIAILPFVYLGDEIDDAYFASGLTEEMIIAFTRFTYLQLIGPLNRDKIQEQNLAARDIGREFNVRFLFDGTVRKRDHMLHVTAKLIDAYSGEHLWAQVTDLDLYTMSIGDIEDEIVSKAAAAVADLFGIVPRTLVRESSVRHPSSSFSDYEPMMRLHHYVATLTEESHSKALIASRQALQRNPDNPMAAASLADLLASTYHLGFTDDLSILNEADSLVQGALIIDPISQFAHYVMAFIHFLRFQREMCLEEIDKTLALNPNAANTVAATALHLGMVGEWAYSIQLMSKAMRLNPHHPGWYHIVPFMDHYRQRDYDSALKDAHRFTTPLYFWDPLIRAAVLGKLGRQLEAKEAVDSLMSLVPDFEERGRGLIQRMVFLDEHVDMLLDGLSKSGVKVMAEM